MEEKKCSKCLKIKDIKEFSFRNKKKGIRIVWCRSCVKIYDKNRYDSQSEEEVKLKRDRDRNRARVS